MKRRSIILALLVVLLSLLAVNIATAQDGGDNADPTISNEALDIAANLTCLDCEEQALDVCTTDACAGWKLEIQELLDAGRNPSYIYRYFADTYPRQFSQNLIRGQFGDAYPPNVDANDVYYIADDMYCDVCAGVALSYCTSGQCRAWREEISDMLADGYGETAIRQSFADRYGEKIAAVPIDESDRFLTFALPIGIVLFFGVALGWQFYVWKRQRNYALDVARSAGTAISDDNRPVPDNVDPVLLQRVLAMVEEKS